MSPPSWSDIPLDLALLVLRLLPSYADRARFAAVCKRWRAAARQPQPPPHPLLALPDGTFYSFPADKKYRFPGCGFAGYKSACGSWLVFPRDDGCFLVNPFTRDTVELPPLSCVQPRPPNAVAKWSHENGQKFPEPYITWMHMKELKKLRLHKLILCSSNLVAAALVGVGRISQILICQPGASSWSVRANDACARFDDIVFFEGKLYAIARDGALRVLIISQHHSTGEPQVSRIGQVIRGELRYSGIVDNLVFNSYTMRCTNHYLMESPRALLMVRRTIWQHVPDQPDVTVAGPSESEAFKTDFDVLEADFGSARWVRVKTVGDGQSLFLGRMCSRAVPMSHYGFRGDYIFFLDDDEEESSCVEERTTSLSTYDMRSGKVRSARAELSWKRCDEMRAAAFLFPWN